MRAVGGAVEKKRYSRRTFMLQITSPFSYLGQTLKLIISKGRWDLNPDLKGDHRQFCLFYASFSPPFLGE